MPMYMLSDAQVKNFEVRPEAAMNVQYAYDETYWYVVIGAMAALRLDDQIEQSVSKYLQERFVQPDRAFNLRSEDFSNWLNNLPIAPSFTFWAPGGGGVGGFIHPPLGAPPVPPAMIYGHCIFRTQTSYDAVFYRYEHWPVSRRVDRTTNPPTIAVDTFASPASEVPFMPTGFSAVARCALPSLLPAIFRYELQPLGRTDIACGASVPLYGQSGGGVEVKFVNGATNRCPMADPVYIPPL